MWPTRQSDPAHEPIHKHTKDLALLKTNNVRKKYNFKWKTKNTECLSVNIPTNLINMCTITKEIKTELDKWVPLKLNMNNQIEIIKKDFYNDSGSSLSPYLQRYQ